MTPRRQAALAICLLIPDALQAQSGCVRHFTNRSNYSWSIAGYDGPQSKLIIAPNTTVAIPYGNATVVTISGYIPSRPYTKQFGVQSTSDSCYELLHQGPVGYITLNKTLNGDVITCSGGC